MTANHFTGKIAVVGCGALGALYGVYLLRGGADVHFLTRSDYDAASRNGYTVIDPSGMEHIFHPPVYRDASDIGPVDLVLVGMKSTDNGALAEVLPPLCSPSTLVLTLQNGLGNEEYVTGILDSLHGSGGAARVLGGVAFLCSNRVAPARIHHIDQGWIHMAEHSGPSAPRTHAIAEAFRGGGVDCHVFESLREVRWQKLAWNIPFNGLSLMANHADTQAILEDPDLRATVLALMEEVRAIAAHEGVDLTPEFLSRLITVTEGIGPYRTSMLLDFEAGRPMETGAILGEPLRRARAHGVSTPRLHLLATLARRWNTQM